MQNFISDSQNSIFQYSFESTQFENRSQPIIDLANSFDSEEEENFTENSYTEKEDFCSTEEFSNKYLALRASTAPARPLSDIEEFRQSSDFLLLEHTVICCSQLVKTEDQKYDLDSDEGQIACKKLLNQIERLCDVFKVDISDRSYRKDFSNAYKVLYIDESLCYLTEILDSAQEGFPYLYVNGEKYLFSQEVLESGSDLYESFNKMQQNLREIYNRASEETSQGVVSDIISCLTQILGEFDSK